MEVPTSQAVYGKFVQPAPVMRWLGVVFAAAGWYFSYQSFRVSAGAELRDPVLRLVCGGQADKSDRCSEVLTSPQAYLRTAAESGGPRIPISTLGMAYFAAAGLWYLFVGPAARDRWHWHLLPALIVLIGLSCSAYYVYVMAYELHRWCTLCLLAHASNGALAALTLLSWPRRAKSPAAGSGHPSLRLALATIAAAGLCAFSHLALVFVLIAGTVLRQRTAEYAKILDDPAFVRWHFEQQAPVEIPLLPEEVFAGSPEAPHTVVTFSDFACRHCRELHEVLQRVVHKYPDVVRIAFRYCPQDPECNPDPRYRGVDGHSGCRAARAAEAARIVGGPPAYLRMRQLLWQRQNELPRGSGPGRVAAQRQFFEDCATSIGLDRQTFLAAFESPASAARIETDLALARQCNVESVPVVYLDGRRVINWRNLKTWDVLLSPAPAASLPARQEQVQP